MLKFSFLMPTLSLLVNLSQGKNLSPREVDPICIGLHCGLQSAACFADSECRQVLDCMGDCGGQPGEAACQFVCQYQFGRENQKYLNLLTCMGDNSCLSMEPDGVCYGDADKTDQTISSFDQISGSWWILKGQNCGQDSTWNGGYDAYPCQQQSFVKFEGSWIRNTTYCTGKDNVCTSPYINVMPSATLESNGVVRTDYTDPLYLKMEERWFIVERVEEDWMFYYWCSENQAAADAGVVVLGRQRTIDSIPASVDTRFRELATEIGIDYDAMCVNDNTNCPF